jgi:hypothetical protein
LIAQTKAPWTEEWQRVRTEDHLEMTAKFYQNGDWLYAAEILNDEGKMVGSMIVCNFSSRETLNKEWLKKEPYILENVTLFLMIKLGKDIKKGILLLILSQA